MIIHIDKRFTVPEIQQALAKLDGNLRYRGGDTYSLQPRDGVRNQHRNNVVNFRHPAPQPTSPEVA